MDEKKQAAGRAGGRATLAKHGRGHFQSIGSKGGRVLHERYRLVPVAQDDFALVHRETGQVKAFLSGRKF